MLAPLKFLVLELVNVNFYALSHDLFQKKLLRRSWTVIVESLSTSDVASTMTFSAPIFISIGDEYDKKGNGLPERFKGRSFVTNPPKKGNGVDVLMSRKFLSLSDGDKYVDPGYYEKRARLEKERKKVGPTFKTSGGAKSPNGSGTYYGTFYEKPIEHMVEYAVTKSGEMPEKVKPHMRNIVTNPPKHGTYGYPGTTLSKGKEFQYVSDPYEGEKRKEALHAKENSKRVLGPAFKGACRRGGFFDETAHGVSKVYTISNPLPAKKPAPEHHAPSTAKSWKPAGSLAGEAAKLFKSPEYMEDPYEAKEKTAREQRKADRPKHGVWKPIGGSKSLPTKSIKFTPA